MLALVTFSVKKKENAGLGLFLDSLSGGGEQQTTEKGVLGHAKDVAIDVALKLRRRREATCKLV